jgi:hypothetical protein
LPLLIESSYVCWLPLAADKQIYINVIREQKLGRKGQRKATTYDIGALRSGKATVAEPKLGSRGGFRVIFIFLRLVLLGVLEAYDRACHCNSPLKLCMGKDPEQPDAFSMTALWLSRLVCLHRLVACLTDTNVKRK